MIFAAVGTQLPFPRLMSMLDRIAGRRNLDIVAQTCDDSFSSNNIESHSRLNPILFDQFVQRSQVFVSHAGIGSMLSARRHGKPIVIVPRMADLGEHRNDHQLATVRQLAHRAGIYVAHDEDALESLLMDRARLGAVEDAGSRGLEAFLKSHLRDLRAR